MKSFLEKVAADLLKRFDNDLSRVAVVFPNKRASLFLNEHLARLAGKPLWSPAYITISDLFRSHSELKVADPILLAGDNCSWPTSTIWTRTWDLQTRCSRT